LLLEAVIFASLFGGIVPYAFLILLTALPVLSLIHVLCLSQFTELALKVQSGRIVRGVPAKIGAALRNKSVFPVPAAYIEVSSDSEYGHKYQFSTGIRKQTEEWTQLTFSRRGLVRFTIKHAAYSDIWNILRLRRKSGISIDLIVYPRLYLLDSLRRSKILTEREERFLRRSWEETGLYSDVRDYEAGDAQTRIHWKLSARKNELISKIYESADNNELLIWLDLHKAECVNAAELEERVMEMAAAVMEYCLRAALPFTLCYRCNGALMSHDGRTSADFEKLYTALATIPFDSGVRLADFARQQMPVRETIVFSVMPDPEELCCLLDNPNRRVEIFCADIEPERRRELPERPSLQIYPIGPDGDVKKILESR
jgi:uncharacterized protein (DUF58 family)